MLQLQLKTPRWKMILNFLRMCSPDQELPNEMSVDRCKIVTINKVENENVEIVDKETGEIYLVFAEDGELLKCGDWGHAEWQWECYDEPLYAYDFENVDEVRRLELLKHELKILQELVETQKKVNKLKEQLQEI